MQFLGGTDEQGSERNWGRAPGRAPSWSKTEVRGVGRPNHVRVFPCCGASLLLAPIAHATSHYALEMPLVGGGVTTIPLASSKNCHHCRCCAWITRALIVPTLQPLRALGLCLHDHSGSGSTFASPSTHSPHIAVPWSYTRLTHRHSQIHSLSPGYGTRHF